MALQVWLPLNGNLNNQGLSNVAVTNNEATINDNGKIGKCYKFNPDNSSSGQKYLMLNKNLSDILPTNGKSFSFACWIKITGNLYSNGCGLIAANQYNATGVGLYINNSTKKIHIHMCYNGTEQEWTATKMTALQNNVWYHVTYTYNEIGRQMTVYINGVNVDSTTANNIWVTRNEKISIGRGSQGGWGYTLPGFMNDVRIYDHCLSPKEVKELSKGLVLHYKLDNMIRSNINLLTTSEQRMSETGQTSSNEYMNLCSAINIWDTYGSVPYTISFEIKSAVAHSFNIYGDYGSNPKYNFTRKSINVTTEWQRFSHTFTPVLSNSSSTWSGISVYGIYGSGAIVSVRKVKLELGNIETPTFTDNNIVYDSSGYQNNGTISGSLSINSNTPRYNYSTLFNTAKISTNKDIFFDVNNKISISLWIYPISNNISILGSAQYQFQLRLNTNNKLYFNQWNSSGSDSLYNTSVNNITLNTWTYICYTWDGTDMKLYINGINDSNFTYKNGNTHRTGNLLNIGGDIYNSNTGGSKYFNGSISDVRIYATTLSENDIKELYNNSANIDNYGNIYSFEFNEEENNKVQILKTGIIKINNFVEVNDCIYLPAGTWIDTGLNYNNGDICKTETIIKYESGGTGRDLMGYSASGGGYWGVTASGYWEPHGEFTYTNSDITKKNTIIYIFSSNSEHGTYKIGALGTSYSVRNKFIYRVRLYKNNILERDLYPIQIGNKVGLFDIIHNEYYLANNINGELKNDNIIEASIFKNKIESNQLLEK